MSIETIIPDIGEIPSFPVETPAPCDWRDGLAVRTPNWLGDFVLCVPALVQLREMLPRACKLMLLAPRAFAPLVEAMGTVAEDSVKLADPHAFPTLSEFNGVRKLHAGAGILFNNSFRDALWMKCAGIPRLYGSAARGRSFLLERAFEFPKRLDRVLNKPHQAAKYLALAKALGAEDWDGKPPALNLFYEPELYSDGTRRALGTEQLLALAPGAMYGDAKKWPPEYYAEVCREWIGEGGTVVLLSAKNEAESARAAISGLPPEHLIDLAGGTTLGELMQILKHAELCLANDSGTMHLSALLGGKGVAVFGSTDPAATSPISKKWRLLYDKQACSPCFRRSCPRGTKQCLYAVPPEAVLGTMKELLRA